MNHIVDVDFKKYPYPEEIDKQSSILQINFNYLIFLAFAIDLITPIFITHGILPTSVRWVSHAALFGAIALAFARMLAFDRIPYGAWVIAGVSAIGFATALYHGQGVLPTAWGWWKLYEFPLVGLFVYLSLDLSKKFPDRLIKSSIVILGLEVIIQIFQYLTGEPIDDHLAGTFGRHGVGPLLLFIVLVLCFVLGRWLVGGNWTWIIIVLGLGTISSVLGSMRIFPFAMVALGLLSFVLSFVKKKQIVRIGAYAAIIVGVSIIFGFLFNRFVPSAQEIPFEEYLNLDSLDKIFSRYKRVENYEEVRVDAGRNYSLIYGWKSIQNDPITFAFGMGIGARTESVALGVSGIGFLDTSLGQSSLTSILVLIQEMGLFGIVIAIGFMAWISIVMYRDINRFPDSKANELRYAVLLFSLLWPLWLWYKTVLVYRVPMLLYWVCIGYVLHDSYKRTREVNERSSQSGKIRA